MTAALEACDSVTGSRISFHSRLIVEASARSFAPEIDVHEFLAWHRLVFRYRYVLSGNPSDATPKRFP